MTCEIEDTDMQFSSPPSPFFRKAKLKVRISMITLCSSDYRVSSTDIRGAFQNWFNAN